MLSLTLRVLRENVHRPNLVTPLLVSLTISPLLLLAGDINSTGRISRKTLFTVSQMEIPVRKSFIADIVGLDKQTKTIRIPSEFGIPSLESNLCHFVLWELH